MYRYFLFGTKQLLCLVIVNPTKTTTKRGQNCFFLPLSFFRHHSTDSTLAYLTEKNLFNQSGRQHTRLEFDGWMKRVKRKIAWHKSPPKQRRKCEKNETLSISSKTDQRKNIYYFHLKNDAGKKFFSYLVHRRKFIKVGLSRAFFRHKVSLARYLWTNNTDHIIF